MDISNTGRACMLLLALMQLQCSHAVAPRSGSSAAPLQVTAADGSRLVLDRTWQEHTATLLVFWSSQCPCVRRYQTRIDDLAQRFSSLRVLGISSNAGETLAEDLAVAKERGARLELWRDEGGVVANALGARSTPTVVLVDKQGVVRYRGWVDNERMPGDPDREAWLERAIEGVLGGRNDFASRSPVYGCAITRSLFATKAPPCCKKPVE